jgi:hypothetical protein
MNSCLPFNSSNPSEYRLIFSLLFRHRWIPYLGLLSRFLLFIWGFGSIKTVA